MGQGYLLHCSKCRYEEEVMTGIGFLYPLENERIKKQIIDGKFGVRFQHMAEKHPNFEVENERGVFVCEECGEFRDEMYIVMKEGDTMLLEKEYRCSTCCKRMKYQDNIEKLKCPNCGESLTATVSLMWD